MADRCSFRSGIISGWRKTWTEIYAGTCFYLYLHYLLIHSADVHRCLSLPGSSCSGDRGDDCFDLSDLRKYKKGICAMTGTISGVLIAGIFATVFGKITRITGYNIEDIETMVYVSQNSKLQIGGVLFSGILIASLGAVMDVAVSISSTIEEIHNKRPELTAKELFKSGIHGKRYDGYHVKYTDPRIYRRSDQYDDLNLCIHYAVPSGSKYVFDRY